MVDLLSSWQPAQIGRSRLGTPLHASVEMQRVALGQADVTVERSNARPNLDPE